MAKDIEETYAFTTSTESSDRLLLVIQTDDGVRYVFEKHDGLRFSHRFLPDESVTESRDEGNYRLPRCVEEHINTEFGGFEYMDEMIPEAQMNQKAVADLDA